MSNSSHSHFGTPSPVEQLSPQDSLGPYIVTRAVDTTSLATTYLGRDPILNRTVEIEQIHLTGSVEDDRIRQRVRDVSSQVKQVTAANASQWVQLLDVFNETRGLFIVTEHVNGQSLEQHIQQDPQPMNPRSAMGVVAAIAAALRPLHAARLVHRDLQPQNVVLQGQANLQLRRAALAAAIDTQYALQSQSVPYMAPEILRGEQADARADLYSLGMIAYRLLAGENKFNDAFKVVVRDQRNAPMRWMKWHTNPRTQAPELTELNLDVPEPISAIVARLMAKAATARFQSTDEVLEAIRRHFASQSGGTPTAAALAGKTHQTSTAAATTKAAKAKTDAPSSNGTSSPGHTAPLPRRRNRLPVILSAILAVWLFVGLIIAGAMYVRQREKVQARSAQTQQTMADARTAFEAGDFAQAGALFQQVADAYNPSTNFHRMAQAGQLRSQAETLMQNGDYREARRKLRELQELNVYDNDTLLELIRQAEEHAAFDTGANHIQQLIREEKFFEAREQIAIWQNLVFTPEETQRLDQLRGLLQQQVKAQGLDATVRRARNLWVAGRRSDAIGELQVAIEHRGDPSQSPELAVLLDRYRTQLNYNQSLEQAHAAQAAGELDKAIDDYREALKIEERVQGDWFEPADNVDRQLAEAQMNHALTRGNALMSEGKLSQARKAFEQSVAFARTLGIDPATTEAQKRVSELSSQFARADLIQQGDDAMEAGNFAEARDLYKQAMAQAADAELADKLDTARYRDAMQAGRQQLEAGELQNAEKLFRQAQQLRPEEQEPQTLINEITVLQQYQTLLDEVRQGQEAGNFREAKQAMMEIEDIAEQSPALIDNEQIEELKNDLEHQHLMALAENYYENEQYRLAMASLQGAMALKVTPQAEAMFEQIKAHLPGLIIEPEEQEPTPNPLPEDSTSSENGNGR